MSDQSKDYLKDLIRIIRHEPIACGFQKLSVSNTAVSLTVPLDANYAIIEVESDTTGAAIRYLELGQLVLPTSTDGISRSNLDAIDVSGYSNLINFRAIQAQSGTHVLQIQYYK